MLLQNHSAATHLQQHSRIPRRTQLVVEAKATAGGFGKSNKKRVDTEGGLVIPKKPFRNATLADIRDDAPAGDKQAVDGAPPGFPKDWVDLKFKAQDMPLGKTAKPVELASRTVMVFKYDGKVFVSDASSTAYQYPLTDARLFKEPETGRVCAEVPLDGTVYDLSTGAVLKWCPKDNPIRGLLGTLKSKENPVDLRVYPVHVTQDGNIWTKLR